VSTNSHSSDSFFYNWSELTIAPWDWVRFGMVTQRTRLYDSDREIQRGFLVGSMPRLNGLDACEKLIEELPDTRLIFLTVNEDPNVAADAFRRGAAGFLLKKAAASELFTALERVLAGRAYITPLGLVGPAMNAADSRRGLDSNRG
jgi:DNA-binding NtrC family response regulator